MSIGYETIDATAPSAHRRALPPTLFVNFTLLGKGVKLAIHKRWSHVSLI